MNTISFNKDWRFCLGENWCEASATDVCLPHTVALTPENSSGCRNYQGKCVYRKNFFVDSKEQGQKAVIEFEGAMGVSHLYVNGRLAKEHFCGYTPLIAEISELLLYGQENLVEVRLDNSDNGEVPPGKPQEVLDFSYDGGLYRNATLTYHGPLYITNPLLENEVAGGGIFVWYSSVLEKTAKVHYKIHTRNDFGADKTYTLKVSLTDELGNTICANESTCSLKAASAEYTEGVLLVNSPKLWSPEEPNLYTLKTEIIFENETVFRKDTEIGIRTFEFTLDQGVIFNGKSRRFNGGNYHHTWPYICNAMPDSMLVRDIMKIKDMGMDNIRSHYPFSTSFVSACNRLGMTLIVSNPGWQFCEPGIFTERAVQNMRDIIRWQRNNPCILFWEPILNESNTPYELQLRFHETTHQEYPYSPCYTASDWGPTDIAYKDYDPAMLGQGLEEYGLVEQKDTTPRPKWIREYGDAPDDFYNQNSVWRCKRGWGDFVMAESVNRMLQRFDCQTGQYLDVYNNKSICGYGVWPAIAHNRGYHINPCWGGHLDIFRVPKFSYYFMRSQKDREEIGDVLFVASWWGETGPDDIMVFSNAEKVQLYRNDELIGEQEPDNLPLNHPPFTFKNVKRNFKLRERSNLIAKAIVGGEVVAEQFVRSPGVPTYLKLEAEFMGIPLKADGADIVAVRCYVMDYDHTVAPLTLDHEPIIFEVEGEGEIVGDASIGANPICAEAGIATVLVRSTKRAGEIKIKASLLYPQNFGKAVKPAELTINSYEE
ncbi:MAG: hypothetical protein IIW94_02945 [Clostridia bacterium]|nr:hypothetical protein [Clostridia bacterium]